MFILFHQGKSAKLTVHFFKHLQFVSIPTFKVILVSKSFPILHFKTYFKENLNQKLHFFTNIFLFTSIYNMAPFPAKIQPRPRLLSPKCVEQMKRSGTTSIIHRYHMKPSSAHDILYNPYISQITLCNPSITSQDPIIPLTTRSHCCKGECYHPNFQCTH